MKSFQSFRLDAANHLLLHGEERVSLTPKAFDVLRYLVERAGRLVTQDELLESLWPETYVNQEVLRKYILEIRKALGDKPDNPEFIETITKRGYRFVATVTEDDPAAAPILADRDSAKDVLPAKGRDPADATPTPAARLNRELPAEVERIINKALEKDREVRLQSAAELHGDLKHLSRDTTSGNVPAVAGPARKLTWHWAAAIMLVISVGAVAFAWLNSPPPPPRVRATTQLTRDGIPKTGLLTDGSRLYTTETGNADRIVQASTNGGETSPIPTPFANPIVNAISPDHSQLLVLDSVGSEAESKFWSVPLPSGAPRRLGDLTGHSGIWSPDGRHVVFCTGLDIYQANADGTDPRKLATVSGEPNGLHFSPDGSRISFSIARPESDSSALWEIRSDGSDLHPLFP
jgi:DNA-binding winged helix-turn-helix (wHTH) protein